MMLRGGKWQVVRIILVFASPDSLDATHALARAYTHKPIGRTGLSSTPACNSFMGELVRT